MEKLLYGLTNPQKLIWFTEEFYKGTPIENITGTVIVPEKVDFSLLEQAINIFVEKSDSFRLKFILQNNKVQQYVEPYSQFSVETIEVFSNKDLKELEKQIATKAFNVLDSLLFVYKMIKFPDGHGGFIVNMHHLISDAWSAGLGGSEIIKIYTRLLKNESIDDIVYPSYIDYINSEKEYFNSDRFMKDKTFWNNMFTTIPDVASIPSCKTEEQKNSDGKAQRKQFTLSKEFISTINEFCKNSKVSLFNFFMAVFSIYIGRVSALDEFVIGTPVLNRSNVKEKRTSGMFINTVPVKISLKDNIKFADLASSISSDLFNIFKHQKYSYLSLLEDLRQKNNKIPNLYNFLMSYQNVRSTAQTSETPFDIEWIPNEHISEDMDVHIYDMNDTGNINIAYDYQTAKYGEQDILKIHERILNIINQILENNAILINDLEIVTPEEKEEILNIFNNTKVDYPKDKTVVQLFEEQVEKTPDNVAVVFEDKKLTYKELNEKANSLAHHLRKNGVKKNEVVGIFLDKSLESIIAILSILKCGAIYMPIDINYPDSRINFMLKDSSASIVLSSLNLKYKLKSCSNVICIDLSNIELYNNSINNLPSNISSTNCAYIMYTSGSTGNPKGVMVLHKNIVRLVKNTNFIKFGNHERILQTGSIVFDACTFEIWGSLLNGFELYIIKKQDLLDPTLLERYLINNGITILWLTAPLFNQLSENNPAMFRTARVLLTGGDVLSPKHINSVKKSCPELTIINGYGPTENTTFSTCFTIDGFYKDSIPIGFPIANSTCYIVSDTLKLLPIGIPGELLVGGDGVSQGYLNNNEFTAEKFIDNPFGEGKLYKTGDLVKWLPDGKLDFIGRVDNQVKIRGFRVELNEITLKVNDFENIKECITIVKTINNEKVICSYFSADNKIETDSLRTWLTEYLPYYSIPTYLIQLDSLPINTNGKVDVKKLPEPQSLNTKVEILLPRNNFDAKLIKLLKDLLNINIISIDDNFLELGGDSLSSINLCAQIQNEFNVQIFVKDILENPIISDLSDIISAQVDTNKKTSIKPAKKMEYYPLSSAQKRIYLSSIMSGENSILYNIPGGIILDKIPDINKLENCLNVLIKRHDSLRTYFEAVNNNIVQKVQDTLDFKLDISLETSTYDNLTQDFKDFVKPFDLSVAPLFRAKLIKIDTEKAALFLDMHHIISDGTSLSIFVDELCKLYNNKTLNKLNISYKDFAVWENGKLSSDAFKEAESYWISHFSDDIPVLNMPTNYPRPAIKSYEGNKVYSEINEEITNKLNNICKTLGVTPYMFLLSAYYILLAKYTGQEDIIVGSPIVGRNIAELYNIIGVFINSLPIKAKVNCDLSFRDFLCSIKDTCLKNYKYQDYPFDELVNKLNIRKDTSRNPLFDTMFIYQNNGYTPVNFDGINAKYYLPDTKISKFDLSLEIVPADNMLNLSFEYCTKLFNKPFIENLSNHYTNILNALLDNLDIKLSEICVLSEKEKNKILYEFNNTKVNYSKDKTISQLFEEQASKSPNKTAVVFGDEKLTYKELNEKANSLAHYLRNNGIGRNDIVGIMVNRSLEMIIAILAVLKAGGAYTPIDPEYPKDRITYMLKNSNAKLLLTQKHLNEYMDFENCINIDLNNTKLYNLDKINLPCVNTSDDLIYVIYTSGSTGLPKGVMLKHQNINNFIAGVLQEFNFTSQDTIVSITTISFDIFVLESLLPLLNGIKMVIASEEEQTDIKLFNDLCKKNNVNIIQTTPSRLQAMLNDSSVSSFIKNIKYTLVGGEPFPPALLEKLSTICSTKIYNMYGPTETAVWSSLKELSSDKKITIGKPIANTQMYILDKYNMPLPVGVPGELFIAGDGVCKGYFNNIELTKKVFVNNPFIENTLMYKTGDLCQLSLNGEIEYLGRIDNQVKIRGLRIELGEIENKILSYHSIKEACVIKQTINNRDFISAYITANAKVNINILKKHLSNSLPKYMIPSYFTVLEELPHTPNGKINKKVLPLPKEVLNTDKEITYIAPKTDLEKKFVSIWEQILNISPIGITDNFFELGGDSILAMNLNIELKSITDSISYADIFKFPTISELIKKSKSKDEEYDFKYLEKNYDKYSDLLNLNNKVPKLFSLKYKSSGNILLTGATGFLGMHVIDSYIKNEHGNIYCLVREEPGLTSQAKLHQKLNYYFGTKYDKLIGKRIFAITGDICKPGFGLSQNELLNLSNNIDIVINTAARVLHYGVYSDFYNTNVKSVKHAIDFCKSFEKKLYHISTLSVSGNGIDSTAIKQNMQNKSYFKESSLYIGQSLENVYIRSKFEAECLVLDSILEGLDAYILRVGNLMPRFKDGIFQDNVTENAFINRMTSFAQIGAIPEYIKDEYLEFTPIDLTANSIIKLITHPNSNNRIFHLFNNNHIYLDKCMKYFKMLNPDFKILTDDEFKKLIKSILNNKKKKELLSSLMNDLDKNLRLMYQTDISIKSDVTIKYLSKIGFSWPKISDKYLTRFINLLRSVI